MLRILLNNQERIANIEREISGVKAQYDITHFEISVMESLKKLAFGSDKQAKILCAIEVKVFGHHCANQEKKGL